MRQNIASVSLSPGKSPTESLFGTKRSPVCVAKQAGTGDPSPTNIRAITGRESVEVVVFAAAMVGALIGFLWYNSFPAQIFMGDTGSLSIGGIIAVFALCIRKELLLPLLCGVFLYESCSVMLQVGYFKYTRRRYGEGRRLLLMAPVHHHYQKKGLFETKIVTRFWIISLLLAAITLVTLKIR